MRYNDIVVRLQKLINAKPTQKELAEALDLNQSAISGRAQRNSEFSNEEIIKIEAYYNISLFAENTKECVNIPVKGEVHASMGYGITVYDESTTATYGISKQLANDLNINLSTSEIIFGSGNSMSPTIQGGDSLLIDKSRREINDGKIYCIRYDGQLLTKRLQKLSKTRIKLISDNKDYEPVIIDFTEDLDFEIIGEVRWSGRVFK